MRNKTKPMLVAVIMKSSVILAYAEVIPRESILKNTSQAAVNMAEYFIKDTLAEKETGGSKSRCLLTD